MPEYPSPDRLTNIPKRLELYTSWLGHIPFVFYLVPQLKPMMVVELGTHRGNSFFAFCQAAKEAGLSTKCYAIDTWRGDSHTGYYIDDIYSDVSKHLQENYPDNAVLLRMTFDEALIKFENGSIDLLHIDGLHTYEAVKHDFETWLPKLSEKAVILLHDTQIKTKDFGVWKFWEEISTKYPSFEFHHSNGLGVLAIGKNVTQEVLNFIDDATNRDNNCKFFEEEGEKILKLFKKKQFKANFKKLLSPHILIAKKLKRKSR